MVTPSPDNLVSDDYLEELAHRAEAIYEDELKALLEPEHNNEFVAIHVETGDYAVAANFRQAKRTMLGRHAIDGKLVVMKIGPEPDRDSPGCRTMGPTQKRPRQK